MYGRKISSIISDYNEIEMWLAMISKLAFLGKGILVEQYGPFETRDHTALYGQCLDVKMKIDASKDVFNDFRDENMFLHNIGCKQDRKAIKSSLLVLADMLNHAYGEKENDKDCIESMKGLARHALDTIYNSRYW